MICVATINKTTTPGAFMRDNQGKEVKVLSVDATTQQALIVLEKTGEMKWLHTDFLTFVRHSVVNYEYNNGLLAYTWED